MTIQEKDLKAYNKNIKNAKAIKRCLEKSWMRPELLKNINYFLENYKLEDEINEWVYDFCSKNHIHLTTLCCLHAPFKIKSFWKEYLDLIKKEYESWKNDVYYRHWRNYDFSISTNTQEKKSWYSREYIWCANWYYYLMLSHDTAYLYDID